MTWAWSWQDFKVPLELAQLMEEDAHVHPCSAGIMLTQCNLFPFPFLELAKEEIVRFAQEHPDKERPWIVGRSTISS
jgi:predicted amidohydrolase YtcJ